MINGNLSIKASKTTGLQTFLLQSCYQRKSQIHRLANFISQVFLALKKMQKLHLYPLQAKVFWQSFGAEMLPVYLCNLDYVQNFPCIFVI